MTPSTLKNVVWGVLAACLIAIGGIGGWVAKGWTVEVEPVVEVAKPERPQKDNSLIAAVKPNVKPTMAEPAIPKGARIQRTLEVKLKPAPVGEGESAQDTGSCKPLDLRIDLLENPDHTIDAQFSTPDGTVLGASNYPAVTIYQQKQRPWLVAASVDLSRQAVDGVVVGRDVFKRVFVGGSLQVDADGMATARALIGANL